MTVLEIIDTAVKVGLGALISGLSTYALASSKFRHELNKTKIDAKFALVKESAMKYEESIALLNQLSYSIRKLDESSINTAVSKDLAILLFQAKGPMNHAESCARLSGLTELADSFDTYSDAISDLAILFTDKFDLAEARLCFQEAIDISDKITPLLSRAYDDILG